MHRALAASRTAPIVTLALLALAPLLGPSGARAVVGAQPADPATWPWTGALLDSGNPDPVAARFCTGTLLRGEWLLTAAHCVVRGDGSVRDPAAIDLAIGQPDLKAVTPGLRIRASQIVVYPGYTPGRFGRDIALVRLSRPSGITAPELSPAYRDATSQAWVAGFGLNEGNQTVLLTGQISVSTPLACARFTRSLPASLFPHSPWGTICGTLPNSLEPSACFGDSGGPLVDFSGRQAAVLGVVSYGPGFCGQGVTTVYSDVAAYRPWIVRVTRGADAAIGLPEIRSVSAKDLGRTIIGRVEWCQTGGVGHRLRAQFVAGRITARGVRFAWIQQVRGRATGRCMFGGIRIPDVSPSGSYEVRAKVIDTTTGMSSYGLPVRLVVR